MTNELLRQVKRAVAIFAIVLVAHLSGIEVCGAASADSGAALESTKQPSILQQEKKAPEIVIEGISPESAKRGDQRSIPVRAFRLNGEPPLPADELLGLISGETGREITIGQLNDLAEKVAEYLRKKGYIAVYVRIPAQVVKDGVVEIDVLPGRYGQIRFGGSGHIDGDRLKAMSFAIKPGMIVTRGALERVLLLMNDLSGIEVKAFLRPSQMAGIADLTFEASDTARIRSMLYVDNWGNRDTGRMEYGMQAAANNFSENGDTLNVGGVTTGHGLKGYVFGYCAWLGHDGLRFAVRHSRVKYALGDTSPDKGATGQATNAGYSVSYPFIRGRSFSLYGTLGYDIKHLLDDNPNIGMHFPRTSGMRNLGLSGDFADSFGGGGKNGFSLAYYRGKLKITDSEALSNDSDKTNGDFAKTVFIYQREQYVAENINFYMSFTGQVANKNLDSSEKLFIDGPEGVRAFQPGDMSGDQGYKVTGEFRWRLPGWSDADNDCYLNFFYDYGSVIICKRPSSAVSNRRSLMGTGLGLLWMMKPDYTVRLDYAWKIGRGQGEAADNGRLWLQVNRYF